VRSELHAATLEMDGTRARSVRTMASAMPIRSNVIPRAQPLLASLRVGVELSPP